MEAGTIKVLLIEDNQEDLTLVKEELSSEISYDIVVAENLFDGLAELKKNKPDVVLLDLALPDSNGMDSFIKFYENVIDVPIVILSGSKDEKLALSAIKLGAQDYLIKGEINNKILLKTIKFAIERYKIYRELEGCKKELNDLKERLIREIDL